jgi:hypothetical protein
MARTGRGFFNDESVETAFISCLQATMVAAGFWDQFETTWACLDCELTPWPAKALDLLRSQYAAVGAAVHASVPATIDLLDEAAKRLSQEERSNASHVLERLHERAGNVNRYIEAFRCYCWNVTSLDDLRLAPFHLLATERRSREPKPCMAHGHARQALPS